MSTAHLLDYCDRWKGFMNFQEVGLHLAPFLTATRQSLLFLIPRQSHRNEPMVSGGHFPLIRLLRSLEGFYEFSAGRLTSCTLFNSEEAEPQSFRSQAEPGNERKRAERTEDKQDTLTGADRTLLNRLLGALEGFYEFLGRQMRKSSPYSLRQKPIACWS